MNGWEDVQRIHHTRKSPTIETRNLISRALSKKHQSNLHRFHRSREFEQYQLNCVSKSSEAEAVCFRMWSQLCKR